MSSDQWEALMAEVDVDQTAVVQSSCRALTTNEDIDDELLLQQVTDQIILVGDEEAHNVANLAAAHAADFMQPVVNPLAVICTAAAGRSVLDQLNRNHLVTPGAAAAAYNIHSPYIQFMTQMHPAAASMMQQMQNPVMISSAATVQSSGEVSVEDHESDEELFLVRPQSHHGHQQQQQLMNYVPQQRRPYEAVLPATDAAETTTASDQLQEEEEEEEEPSVQQQRKNMLQSGSTTRTTGPFRIHQALQDELNHQFHLEKAAAAAAAADDPAAADPQLEAAAGRQLLGVRNLFDDAEASAATSSREFNSTTIWQQDDQAGVHLLQRLPPHVTAAGPRVLRRRSRANRGHLLHINSVAAASPLLRSDLNMGTAVRTTPSSNSTITLGLLAAGAAAADPSLLEIEARQVLREQQQQQVDQKSTTAAAAGSTTFCMSSMIGSACSTQETSNTLTSCCSSNNNSIGENFECNICFQKANEAVVTCCGHLFCWPCLYSWLHVHSFHKECPVCKGVIAETAITPIYGRDHGHSTTSSSCNPQQQQSANNSGAAAAGSTHAQTAGAADTVDDVDATTTTTTTTTRSSHESPRIPPRPQARRVESARQQRGRDERERERERERAAATLIRETEAAAAAARSSLQALSLQTQLPATAADHEIADEYAQAAADQLLNNSFTDPDDQELYNSVLDHHHQHQHHLTPDRYAPVDSSSSSLQVIRAWAASNSQSAGAPPPPPSSAAAADQMIITAAAGAHDDELIINNNTRLMRLDHETRLMTAVSEDLDDVDDGDDLLQQQQLHTRSMLQLLPGYIADHVDDIGVVIDQALQEV
jgi:hypothetical protein